MIPSPFPLQTAIDLPNAEWVMVVVTTVGVAASVAVALSAFASAREARQIADASERARVQSEERREQQVYDRRLEDALGRLLQAIAAQLVLIQEWLRSAEEIESHGYSPSGEIEYEPVPLHDLVDVPMQIVRMTARDDDADFARELAHSLTLVGNLRPFEMSNPLRGLVQTVRSWRTGEETPASAMAYLAEFQRTHDPR